LRTPSARTGTATPIGSAQWAEVHPGRWSRARGAVRPEQNAGAALRLVTMPRPPTILGFALCLPLTERGPSSCRGSRRQHDPMLSARRQRACARTCGKPWGQVAAAVDYRVGACGQPARGWGQDVEPENSITAVTSLSDAASLWTKKKFRAERGTERHRPEASVPKPPSRKGGTGLPAAARPGPWGPPPPRVVPRAAWARTARVGRGDGGRVGWRGCGRGSMGYSWPRCRDPPHVQSVPRPLPQSRWSESCVAPGDARRSPRTGTATPWSCCCRAA
jgi:hypothetical protein